jgi:IclR family acetate operon transcriptional repressor
VREIVHRVGLNRKTEHTLVTEAGLLADLTEVRARGYALDEQEQEAGVRCVAVPVGPEPMSWMAVSVSGPVTRMTDELVARAVPLLHEAGRQLTSRMLSTD